MWELWAQWRYRGLAPDVAWTGRSSPWPGRVELVLSAFALHAAEIDGTLGDALEGLASGLSES